MTVEFGGRMVVGVWFSKMDVLFECKKCLLVGAELTQIR